MKVLYDGNTVEQIARGMALKLIEVQVEKAKYGRMTESSGDFYEARVQKVLEAMGDFAGGLPDFQSDWFWKDAERERLAWVERNGAPELAGEQVPF